jgi:hypothetical protein
MFCICGFLYSVLSLLLFDLSSAFCCVLITRFMFFIICFMCVLLSVLCVLCFCVVLCIVSPYVRSCFFSICVQVF